MTRRNAPVALMLAAALALAFGPSALAQTKKMGSSAKKAQASKTEQMANMGFGVAESLSGKILMVVPEQNLVVISGPNDVPYDLVVSPKTVIVVGDKRGTLASLAGQIGKQVSVGFVPQRDGNHATRIEVTG
jgi:hypothetical protein